MAYRRYFRRRRFSGYRRRYRRYRSYRPRRRFYRPRRRYTRRIGYGGRGRSGLKMIRCEGMDYKFAVPGYIKAKLEFWAGLIIKAHILHDNKGKQYPRDVYHRTKKNLIEDMIKHGSYQKWLVNKRSQDVAFIDSTLGYHSQSKKNMALTGGMSHRTTGSRLMKDVRAASRMEKQVMGVASKFGMMGVSMV